MTDKEMTKNIIHEIIHVAKDILNKNEYNEICKELVGFIDSVCSGVSFYCFLCLCSHRSCTLATLSRSCIRTMIVRWMNTIMSIKSGISMQGNLVVDILYIIKFFVVIV